MKRCALLIFFSITWATLVHAHVLTSDGSIGAVMHIDPEDDPIIGKPAVFYFEIKDKENKFSHETCDCMLLIKNNGKEIFTESQIARPPSFIFPHKGVYSVEVVGKPKTTDTFQPFTLTYDLRIEREYSGAGNASSFLSIHLIHIILVGGIFGWFFGRHFLDIYRKKHATRQR